MSIEVTKIRPIIFLDIEGVLVTENYEVKCNKVADKIFIEFDGHERERFDPICVENLKIILKETQAVMVITSTWRLGLGINGLIKLFEYYEINNVIIGRTPFILNKKTGNEIQRGYEIKYWLRINRNIKGVDTSNFVIIDDEQDMNHLAKYLILTSHKNGITPKVAETAIHKLTFKNSNSLK